MTCETSRAVLPLELWIAADAGKFVPITANIAIPASTTFSAGEAVTIYNNSTTDKDITSAVGVTAYLAGTATTGTRTLAQRGLATLLVRRHQHLRNLRCRTDIMVMMQTLIGSYAAEVTGVQDPYFGNVVLGGRRDEDPGRTVTVGTTYSSIEFTFTPSSTLAVNDVAKTARLWLSLPSCHRESSITSPRLSATPRLWHK